MSLRPHHRSGTTAAGRAPRVGAVVAISKLDNVAQPWIVGYNGEMAIGNCAWNGPYARMWLACGSIVLPATRRFLVTCKPASAGGIRLARQGCRTLRASRSSGAPAARSGTATRHGGRRFPVPIGGGGMGADPDHSLDEDRFILLGVTGRDRLVVVAHTLRSDTIRRINAAAAADCCLMLPDASLTCQFMRETGDPIPEPTTVVADSVTVG